MSFSTKVTLKHVWRMSAYCAILIKSFHALYRHDILQLFIVIYLPNCPAVFLLSVVLHVQQRFNNTARSHSKKLWLHQLLVPLACVKLLIIDYGFTYEDWEDPLWHAIDCCRILAAGTLEMVLDEDECQSKPNQLLTKTWAITQCGHAYTSVFAGDIF